MDSAPLIAAGFLAVLGAAVHGAGGEFLVLRNVWQGTLPPSRFGGPRMTQAMIHVSWHIATVAFLTIGVALLLSGSILERDAARGISVVGAVAFTGFAALAAGMGAAHTHDPRGLLRHPGPAVLGLTAALAWWGALSL